MGTHTSVVTQRATKAFDKRGVVLHCGSFTKCLAPGFKIGWVAAGRFRESIVHRKVATMLGTSVPPQAAIAHYLKNHVYARHLRPRATSASRPAPSSRRATVCATSSGSTAAIPGQCHWTPPSDGWATRAPR